MCVHAISKNLTCGDDDISSDLPQLFLWDCRPVQLLHADRWGRLLAQPIQPDVVSEFLQHCGVTVAEDESLRAARPTDGDTRQPRTAAQLQHRPEGGGANLKAAEAPPGGRRPADPSAYLPVKTCWFSRAHSAR